MSEPGEGSSPDTDPARDRRLIELAATGDRAAFAELMERHEDMVFAVSLRMMRDREAALDATQETFVTLFRKADRYRGDAAVSTWLYRVTVNTCLDLLRKQRRRPSEPLPDHFDPTDPTGEDAYGSAELRPSIEEALAELPDEFRAAVVLSDLEGRPLGEVASILGVPEGTVKSRVFRARRLLAARLGNLHPRRERQSDEDHA